MRNLMGELMGAAEETPLGKAQEVLDQAFEEDDPERRSELARQALAISPDCADAYTLLAEQAASRKEAFTLYEEAVAASERAIGPDAFAGDVGHFWGLLETRPYMRAREGLAHTLWALGRREEAAGHFRDMLRLNPDDNQGIRYILSAWLLNLDRDDELAGLLEQYDDASASWTYTKALLAFRREGDTPETRKRLRAARKSNKYVPAYLLGDEPLPLGMPATYGIGEPSEAILYAASHLGAWRSTQGAISWLREGLAPPGKKKSKARPPAGPSEVAVERLRRLPQRFDVWQVDGRAVAHLVESEGKLVQPWMSLVTSTTDGTILAHEMALEPPIPAQFWDLLARAMQKPMAEEPHRPTQLQVRPGPGREELQPHLEALGIEWVEVDDLDQVDFLLDDLSKHLTRDAPLGLLDIPGQSPERVAGFYRAAAEFYRRAPWKSLGYEEAIEVECEQYQSGPWYAVVMGQSGLTLGLALYEDLNLLKRMWAEELSEEENVRETVALTATFDPEADVSPADVLASHEHGWEVAGPEAHPSVFRKERGMSMRPPLSWELELLEGCLRAIPDFVDRHRPGDTDTVRMTVPVATRTLDLGLSWVGEG